MAPSTPGDPTSETAVDVDSILADLTIDEKVGQLVGTFVGEMESKTITPSEATSLVKDVGVGSVAAFGIGASTHRDPVAVAELVNELQRTAVEETRAGIPLLHPVDAVHGNAYVDGATVFPHGLGMAATRNPDLVRQAADVTAAEIRATGAQLNYAPTCDVARDPRWGRTFETFGESPHLCGAFAAASIEGHQSDDPSERVATTAKHFPAYGDPEAGEDTAVVDCSTSTLHRTFLPPFVDAFDAGVDVVMPCYNAVGDDPVHGSGAYLTDLLRDDLGFDGVVVSDWGGVDMLHDDHRVTRDRRGSARASVDAGLDHVSIGGRGYAEALRELVASGDLDEGRVDEAVRRVLRLKRDLGLFEDPYVDIDAVTSVVGQDAHREVALDAARESQTLLKNDDDVLPLDPDLDEVLVTGPNADALQHQLGGWSIRDVDADDGTTVREGLEAVVGVDATVRYEPGATTREPRDLDAAATAAADADAAVVVLGENWYYHEFGPQSVAGPTGAFPTRTEIGLPDAQRELLERVHATGTPTVLVLVTGRPLAIPWAAEHVPGILMSYYPGSEGGRAVAETLFGAHDPSGRLPIAMPRSASHLPVRHDRFPTPAPIGADEHPDGDALYPFGHGLTYTEFQALDLSLDARTIGPTDAPGATLTVENVGDRPGRYAVDAFLRDVVSSRVRPEREHVAFGSVDLEPGETGQVELSIPNAALGVVGPDGDRRVEPGEFELVVDDRRARFEVDPSRGVE